MKPSISMTPRNAAQLSRFMSNISGGNKQNCSRQASTQNMNFESVLYQLYKTNDSLKASNLKFRGYSGEHQSMSKMNSIQQPCDRSIKFPIVSHVSGDNSPANGLPTAIRRHDTETIFRGDSFHLEHASISDTGNNFFQNTVVHKTGICPHCRQPLPADFGQYLNLTMPPDTVF